MSIYRLSAILALTLCCFLNNAIHSAETILIEPASGKAIIFPDFDKGIMRGGKSKKTFQKKLEYNGRNTKKSSQQERLRLLRSNYDRIVATIKQNVEQDSGKGTHIPRIIHQIWLGSEVPEKYQQWMSTWMNWLGWEYKLWTDQDVAKLQLVNQKIYDDVDNYGAKSDILRIELLYMMGGIYVDTDFECLNPDFFELLHKNVDFYIGIEPLEHTILRINNALIGSAPGHPLLLELITKLPAHYEANKHRWPLASTGPIFITKFIYDYLKEYPQELDLLLPCSLVYPYTSSEVDRSKSPDQLKPMNESAAAHYWSKSWFSPQRPKPVRK